jgi:magnesium chelatase accessory protein
MPSVPTDILGPIARLFAGSPLTARALALMVGGEGAVQRLIRSGGSTIDPEGARLYARLTGTPAHVSGALRLMANWDLRPLARDLPQLATQLTLVTGSSDRMVPPFEAYRVRSLVPRAELVSLPGLGHLAHEERPEQVAAILLRAAAYEAAA